MTHGYLDGLFICDSGFRAHLSMQTGLKRAHNAARAVLTSHRNLREATQVLVGPIIFASFFGRMRSLPSLMEGMR